MASGRNSPSAKPQANGMMMPNTDAEIEARLLSFTSLRSVSMPVISRISSTPNCDTASSIAFCSLAAGNRACCTSGKQRAEERGAEHQAGHELSHHRGLPQPQQDFAQQPADQHQHDELDEEDRLGRRPGRRRDRPPRRPPRRPARIGQREAKSSARSTSFGRIGAAISSRSGSLELEASDNRTTAALVPVRNAIANYSQQG